MEHLIQRGASGANSTALGAGVLRRRHVGAGLGRGVWRNHPSGGTDDGLRGRRDQEIGTGGVS